MTNHLRANAILTKPKWKGERGEHENPIKSKVAVKYNLFNKIA